MLLSMTYTVTMTELRRSDTWDRFSTVFAADPEAVFTVTRYGKPVFCIVSPQYYEALTATEWIVQEMAESARALLLKEVENARTETAT